MAVYIYQLSTDQSLCSWFQLITCWAEPALHSLPVAAARCLQMHLWGPYAQWEFPPLSDLYSLICTCLGPISHQSPAPSSPIPAPRSHQRAVVKDELLLSFIFYIFTSLSGASLHSLYPCPAVRSIFLSSSSPLMQLPTFSWLHLLLLLALHPLPFSSEELLLSLSQSTQTWPQPWLQRQTHSTLGDTEIVKDEQTTQVVINIAKTGQWSIFVVVT